MEASLGEVTRTLHYAAPVRGASPNFYIYNYV